MSLLHWHLTVQNSTHTKNWPSFFSGGPTATYLLTRGSCPSPVESLTVGWLFGRALDIALGDPASAVNGEGSQLLIHQLLGALAEQLDKKKLERLEALPYLTFKDLREAQPAICQTFHCTGYTMPQLADQVEQTASVMNYQFWSANCQKKNYTEADGSWNQTEPS